MQLRRTVLEALPALLLASAITVVAGFLLDSTLTIGEVGGILIITPAIICIGGDIGTSFGARIATHLHSGLIEPRFKRTQLLWVNFFAMFFCGLIVSVVVGIVGWTLGIFISPGKLTLLDFLILSLGAGSIEYLAILFVSLFVALVSFRRCLDPDNLVAPLVTTIADLIGIGAILLILKFLV